MQIACFDDLLAAARAQAEPQRLLLVFAGAELPEGSSADERARFEAGRGGALVPLCCVDKAPDELSDFASLVEEARDFVPTWAILFVAALSGRDGRPPADGEVDRALERMVDAIRGGRLDGLMPVDRNGRAVRLEG